jgi:hypothetical protein
MSIELESVTSELASKGILFGRGLGKLVAGLMEGDPVAWGITGVVVVILIGYYAIKSRLGHEE